MDRETLTREIKKREGREKENESSSSRGIGRRKISRKRKKKKNSKSSLTVRSCPSWWDAAGWFAVRTFRPRIVYRVPALEKKKKKRGSVN